MIRATTPKHTFIFETDPNVFSRILVTYAQKDKIVLEKEKEDLTIEELADMACGDTGYCAWFRMTQEETKKFDARYPVQLQVRVLTTSGEALASDKKTLSVLDVLNDEVLL